MLKRWLFTALLVCLSATLAAGQKAEPHLPAQTDGFLLIAVEESLTKAILAAQDGAGTAFTIAIDEAKAEPLVISPERLRDYQNVFFRVTGGPGAWRLEERPFVVTGVDPDSQLIRKALAVPAGEIFFLPGREHLLVPAKRRVVIQASGRTWQAQVGPQAGPRAPRRAVVLRAGQPVPLLLGETVSALTVRTGQTIPLTVAEDVRVNGLVVVPQGAATSARVVSVHPPGFFGVPGQVVLELGPVGAVDGTEVRLRGAFGPRLTFQGRATWPFRRGHDVGLPAGARLQAKVASAVVVLAPE